MFAIYYKKNKNGVLFGDLEKNYGLTSLQNYVPIYNNFFDLNESNFESINLNHHYTITRISDKETNGSECTVKVGQNTCKKRTFLKFSPLIDPIKFMAGRYEKLDKARRISMPKLSDNTCHPKVGDPNNSAYVDSFFSFLTSHILHKHKFIHGLDFYGSFLGVKENFDINIIDDLEYLHDSTFFHKNKGQLFDIDPLNEVFIFDADTRNCKRELVIKHKMTSHSILSLGDKHFDAVFEENKIDASGSRPGLGDHLIFDQGEGRPSRIQTPERAKTIGSQSTCSSSSSHTTDSEQEEVEDEEESYSSHTTSVGSTISTITDIYCEAVIHNYPVQIICLEYMEGTLDSLLGGRNEMDSDQWRSCLFQIIVALTAYQKAFAFTHNDLHSNNIMFTKTDREHLYYKHSKKYYKVPTYGRIFKLIDFGRAIYRFKGKIICSDSFHPKGDAATQYNCEPFFNASKARLEPNSSFDLCRLACSLFDYFESSDGGTEDDKDELLEKEWFPVRAVIEEWCQDDKGRNILYKKGGEERYPNFKLYKMIARTVHKHVPEKQIGRPLFHKFLTSRRKIKGRKPIVDLDIIPVYS